MRVFIGVLSTFVFLSSASAAIATLSQGKTYFNMRGGNASKNIVIIHSNTFSSWTVSRYDTPLNKADFNVLRFDLYGMGKSARLKTESYSRMQFFAQLEDMIAHVGWDTSTKPLYLIGSGTGASLAAMYALKYPHRVKKIVVINPALNVKSTRTFKLRAFVKIMKQFPESTLFRGMLKTRVESGVAEFGARVSKIKMTFIRARVKNILKTDYVDGFYRRLIGDSYNSYSLTYKKLGKMNFPMMIVGAELNDESPAAHRKLIADQYAMPQFLKTVVYKNVGSEMTAVMGRRITKEVIKFVAE